MSHATVPPPVTTNWPKLHEAIHKAKSSSDVTELRALLESESIDSRSDSHLWRDATVLHTAARSNLEVVDLLLAHGADHLVNARCGPGEDGRWAGQTPIQVAAKDGANGIVARLIRAGAEYDIFSAAAIGDTQRILEIVESDRAAPKSRNEYNSTPLHWAAYCGQFEAADLLLKNGAEVGATSDFGETPLLLSSIAHRCESGSASNAVAQLLVERGAARDASVFAAFGDAKSLEAIVEANPESISQTNSHGSTPLHWAARNGHVTVAKKLLDRHAYVNATDAIGATPLWYASYWGRHVKMTRLLCKNGADTLIKNVWGKSITDYDIGWDCHTIVLRYQPS